MEKFRTLFVAEISVRILLPPFEWQPFWLNSRNENYASKLKTTRIIIARARGNWRANGTHAWNWLHGYYCLALGQWIVSSVNSMVCRPVSVVT